jgi:predicted GNAT family acetyltransferase
MVEEEEIDGAELGNTKVNRLDNLGKMDYFQYFSKGKHKIDVNCCSLVDQIKGKISK